MKQNNNKLKKVQPLNLNMIKLGNPGIFAKLEALGEDILIDGFFLWLASKDVYDLHMNGFIIRYIANRTTVDEDAIQDFINRGIIDTNDIPLNTILLIRNYEFVFNLINKYLNEGVKPSSELVKEFHKALCNGVSTVRLGYDTIGEYRKTDHDYSVFDICDGVNHRLIESEMENVFTSMQGYNAEFVIANAADLFAKIVQIRPFEDFNIEAAMLIANYYLMMNRQPPILFANSHLIKLHLAIMKDIINDDMDDLYEYFYIEVKNARDYFFSGGQWYNSVE